MTVTTLTSRQFNQNTGGAKRAAKEGPVFITDRGDRAFVLLSIEAYEKLAGKQESLLDQLAMEEGADIEFDPPRLKGPLAYSNIDL